MNTKFTAKQLKAIQRYAVKHELLETKCKPPMVVFKDPDTKNPVNVPIDDLMKIDEHERREERKANKKARIARRHAVEAQL